jgi:hypothetical protein
MADEPHEVVKLLLARMESHPEEFTNATDRGWGRQIDLINVYGNEADVAAINAGMRNVRLAEAHSEVMDELLNGDERRAMEKEEHEYEKHMSASLKALKAKQIQQNTQNAILHIDADTYTN